MSIIPDRYARSAELLRRALAVIPLGSQTFSKSYRSFPRGAAPAFLVRGQGGHVWDVDGNEYVDLVCGLLPIVLGYDDAEVTAAVEAQLRRGITFSLGTELEVELAEELVDLIPCAEMVRFGKNGSDVTAGAIRLARAYTGRERVAVCGYHGWQDWYIGSTSMHRGVPEAVRGLTHAFTYNDLDSLERVLTTHRDECAAVIMEPMTTTDPAPGFLAGVRDLAHAHGALFILDEIITGFRFHVGGAQALFGVTPDLATFGKSMANGLPIAALVGKREIMQGMEDIFFSFTFGGEALSLAGALATIRKMRRQPVITCLWERGQALQEAATAAIVRHGLSHAMGVAGKPCWSVLQFRDVAGASQWEIKTVFLEQVIRRGVLTAGSHNVCYAHTADDVAHVASAYDAACAVIADGLAAGDLTKRMVGEPLRPLFRVR